MNLKRGYKIVLKLFKNPLRTTPQYYNQIAEKNLIKLKNMVFFVYIWILDRYKILNKIDLRNWGMLPGSETVVVL